MIVSLLLAVVVAVPSKPNFYNAFTASYNQSITNKPPLQNTFNFGTIAFNKNLRWQVMNYTNMFFDRPLNQSSIWSSTNVYSYVNDQCRAYIGYFGNMFEWVTYPQTVFNGSAIVGGVAVNIWFMLPNNWMYATDSFPVLTIQDNVKMYYWNVKQIAQTTPLALPRACVDPPAVCKQSGWIQAAVFRTHWLGDNELGQRNVADLIGDVAFLCYEIQYGAFIPKNDTVLSQYSLHVNTTFGQYAQCNQGICFGGDNRTVGREASLGFTSDGGQCSNNAQFGSWYSLKNVSECAAHVNPPTTSCSWKLIRKIKSISTQCLADRGLLDACAADVKSTKGFPFTVTTALISKAFKTDNPRFGGCPAV